jgi:hypothetical protein
MLLAGEPPCAARMPMGGSPILRVLGEPATGSAGDTAGGSAWSVVGWEAASKILSGPLPGVRPGVKAPSSGLRPQGADREWGAPAKQGRQRVRGRSNDAEHSHATSVTPQRPGPTRWQSAQDPFGRMRASQGPPRGDPDQGVTGALRVEDQARRSSARRLQPRGVHGADAGRYGVAGGMTLLGRDVRSSR